MKSAGRPFYYDFHIHSCLSPCGSQDMTPNNIVRMARLKGLDAIALTDHNTWRNCAAAVQVGKREGLLVIPGMELCTSEDIHVVCLFGDADAAGAFGERVYGLLPYRFNREDIFGEQLVLDEEDRVTGREERFLLGGAAISVNEAARLTGEYGGVAFPAHVDRGFGGILAVLGGIPPEAEFTAIELSSDCPPDFIREHRLESYTILYNSDAHDLWQISEREHFLTLTELTEQKIFDMIENFSDLA